MLRCVFQDPCQRGSDLGQVHDIHELRIRRVAREQRLERASLVADDDAGRDQLVRRTNLARPERPFPPYPILPYLVTWPHGVLYGR